jgi:photosystem II stability/assembly factor-like uncharacterized protein
MDGGASWSTVNSGLDNFIIQGYDYISALAIDSQDPNTVYAARHDVCEDCTAALFRTTDNGASWTATTLGRADTVISLATDPQILGTIYAGTSVGIFSSTDGGARWNAVKSRLTSDSYGRLVIPALAIDPQNSAIVYAATSSAGIFKTTDAGATWTIVNSDLKATTPADVTVLRIDPQNPGTMYAMTDEGIFKTLDAGATWIGVNAGLPLSPVFDIASNKVPTLSALEIAPQGPSTIYAVDACCQEIFKSTDDGASWNTTLARGADGIVLKGARLSARSLAIDTHDPPTVYAAGWYTQSGPGPMPGNGLFKSTDAGGHWIWIGTGLPNSLMASVAVDPLNPEVVYAGTAVGGPLTPGFGLFKTTNGGRSWKKAGLDGFSSRVDVVGIDPQDSNILYAVAYSQSIPWPAYPGGFGFLFKSTNGGASWTGINSGFPNYVTALAINPQYPNTLYAGTPFGVFRSIDGGANWDAINSGLTSPAVTSLAIAPQDPNTVYAATTDGVFAITFGP